MEGLIRVSDEPYAKLTDKSFTFAAIDQFVYLHLGQKLQIILSKDSTLKLLATINVASLDDLDFSTMVMRHIHSSLFIFYNSNKTINSYEIDQAGELSFSKSYTSCSGLISDKSYLYLYVVCGSKILIKSDLEEKFAFLPTSIVSIVNPDSGLLYALTDFNNQGSVFEIAILDSNVVVKEMMIIPTNCLGMKISKNNLYIIYDHLLRIYPRTSRGIVPTFFREFPSWNNNFEVLSKDGIDFTVTVSSSGHKFTKVQRVPPLIECKKESSS